MIALGKCSSSLGLLLPFKLLPLQKLAPYMSLRGDMRQKPTRKGL